jgi:transposase-like protein
MSTQRFSPEFKDEAVRQVLELSDTARKNKKAAPGGFM